MREITTALRCPLVTFSIPFEEKYAINVREYGKEEYLRANPRHQTGIDTLSHILDTPSQVLNTHTPCRNVT